MLEEFERIAACAPEALKMLLEREWDDVADDGESAIARDADAASVRTAATPSDPWLALMRKGRTDDHQASSQSPSRRRA